MSGSITFERASGEIAGGGGGSTLVFTCGASAELEPAAEQAANNSTESTAVAAFLNATTGGHQPIHTVDRRELKTSTSITCFPDHVVSSVNSDVVNCLNRSVIGPEN